MKKTFWVALPLIGIIGAGCNQGASPVGGGGGGEVLAVVNGDAIPLRDFHNYLERKRSVQVLTPQGQPVDLRVAGTLGLQGMRDMVNRQILLQMAKDGNVLPTDAEITKEIDFKKKQDPDFIQNMTSMGLTLADITEDLRVDRARFNLETKGITVTTTEVDDFIKANQARFVNPATAEVYWVVVDSDAKKAMVDQDLKAGQQFPIVASRYSTMRGAGDNTGRYPVSRVDQMPQKVQDIVKATAKGAPSAWLKDGTNWVRFYVQNKTAATPLKIDDTVRESVRRELMEARGRQAMDLSATIADRLKTAKVETKVPYLATQWKRMMDAMKSQDANKSSQ